MTSKDALNISRIMKRVSDTYVLLTKISLRAKECIFLEPSSWRNWRKTNGSLSTFFLYVGQLSGTCLVGILQNRELALFSFPSDVVKNSFFFQVCLQRLHVHTSSTKVKLNSVRRTRTPFNFKYVIITPHFFCKCNDYAALHFLGPTLKRGSV